MYITAAIRNRGTQDHTYYRLEFIYCDDLRVTLLTGATAPPCHGDLRLYNNCTCKSDWLNTQIRVRVILLHQRYFLVG